MIIILLIHAFKDCERYSYGEECDNRCSPHCAGGPWCDAINGTCSHGCEKVIDLENDDWWAGERCDVIVRKYTADTSITY